MFYLDEIDEAVFIQFIAHLEAHKHIEHIAFQHHKKQTRRHKTHNVTTKETKILRSAVDYMVEGQRREGDFQRSHYFIPSEKSHDLSDGWM
ncbi:hypothetical protein TNCV_2198771 [Trichonephila clavipes]|nr:hypothetical protein TNCV_2198771 [Trichonephila clavipes]